MYKRCAYKNRNFLECVEVHKYNSMTWTSIKVAVCKAMNKYTDKMYCTCNYQQNYPFFKFE